ncbi:PREDICTED: H/ACA ribonucleoprotein complex non-core subunit NAF1 [Rhagoletis zephyria]|uniref:H/ACA ribonucleoprotein complex non-core subunit NAF1 n=1 Tax=Rhagoletis zephyria TaxID=28612 RepID=UPI0008118399|nr:PREDICTED: H/ACA ribonucleoprotein complex non-core subunit NAF1 [Rhagoletis zephyria]
MDKEIEASQSELMEDPQGSGFKVLDQTVLSALLKEDINTDLQNAPIEDTGALKACVTPEVAKVAKEVLGEGTTDCEVAKTDSCTLVECVAPEVAKVAKVVLGEGTNNCETPKTDTGALIECVDPVVANDTREVLGEEIYDREMAKTDTSAPEVVKISKDVLGEENNDCEILKTETSPLVECIAPEVAKITKQVLGEDTNDCEMLKMDTSALIDYVAPVVEKVTEEVLCGVSNECEMKAASIMCVPSSIEEIQKTNNAENHAKISNKEAVVIESVIQIVPASDDLDHKTSTLEVEAMAKPSSDAIVIVDGTDAGMAPDTDVIEVMDITQTEKSIISNGKRLMPAKATSSSLGLLSQYGSDSDETISSESEAESVVEVPVAAINKTYRSQIVEIESDSSGTISSESESETESEYLTKIAKHINKRIEAIDDENNDDDGDEDDYGDNDGKETKNRVRRQPPRVRGEMLLDDLPPIQDLHISMPAEECIEFGRVHSIVDQLLLVSALPNSILLDLETVLFLEQGKRVLGVVFDVLGQVADPLYCVRFNTNQHIHEKGINIGDVVYVAPKSEHTQYVILSSLTKMRGSDASWENDTEPPPRYIDYSDDEEEREARHKLRKHRRQSIKEEDEEDKDDDADADADDKDKDPMKRSWLSTAFEGNKQRRERPSGSRRNDLSGNYQKRQERFGSQSPYTPRSYHQQNTSSWHSHYNQQYHPRPPPTHVYRSPYTAPYQYQRPQYHTPPPRFNPYVHPPAPMSMQMPTAQGQLAPPMEHPPPQMTPPTQMHSMPPPTHMTSPPSMHSMPPPTHMTPPTSMYSMPPPHMPPPSTAIYVPSPYAFRPSTVSPQIQMQQPQMQQQQQQQQIQPQGSMQITSTAEPSPPGAD